MAIVLETSASAEDPASTDTLTITKPTGTVSGDVLVAFVRASTTTETVSSTGWTNEQLATNSHRLAMLWLVAGGSEPASYNFVWTAAVSLHEGWIGRFSGVDNATAMDVSASTNTGSGNTATATGVTTATDGAMLVNGMAWNDATATHAPDQLTENFDGSRLAANFGIQATAGPSGDKTSTLTNAPLWMAILGALRPVVVGGDLDANVTDSSAVAEDANLALVHNVPLDAEDVDRYSGPGVKIRG